MAQVRCEASSLLSCSLPRPLTPELPCDIFARAVHPQLRIVSQLPLGPTVEQLMSQWVRTVPTRSWMWSYGRIPLHLIMDEWLHTVSLPHHSRLVQLTRLHRSPARLIEDDSYILKQMVRQTIRPNRRNNHYNRPQTLHAPKTLRILLLPCPISK